MKKVFFILLLLLALAVLASYVFIPNNIKVLSVASSSVNYMAAHRVLMNNNAWESWWPGKDKFSYNGSEFDITKKMLNSFELSISRRGDTVYGIVQIIPGNADSIQIGWSCTLLATKNPINRIIKYKEAVALKKDLDFLLTHLSNYLGKKENIYGFEIKQTIVTDSVLISTRKKFDHYPDEFEIDQLIQKLRNYIRLNNAKEMNYPMLNVRQLDSNRFDAMVAIATDRTLMETKDFAPKALLKGGNLLEADVRGGHYIIRKSFIEFENYKMDYGRTSPAIPYQLLITNRVEEKDTLKWKTKICFPVF